MRLAGDLGVEHQPAAVHGADGGRQLGARPTSSGRSPERRPCRKRATYSRSSYWESTSTFACAGSSLRIAPASPRGRPGRAWRRPSAPRRDRGARHSSMAACPSAASPTTSMSSAEREQGAHPLAQDGVVVGDQDADRGMAASSPERRRSSHHARALPGRRSRCATVPPSSSTRSRMPSSPRPRPVAPGLLHARRIEADAVVLDLDAPATRPPPRPGSAPSRRRRGAPRWSGPPAPRGRVPSRPRGAAGRPTARSRSAPRCPPARAAASAQPADGRRAAPGRRAPTAAGRRISRWTSSSVRTASVRAASSEASTSGSRTAARSAVDPDGQQRSGPGSSRRAARARCACARPPAP